MTQARDFISGPRRDRTCDPLIKSQSGPRPLRAARRVRVAKLAESLTPRDRRPTRAGAARPRSPPSWLQRGCRNRLTTGHWRPVSGGGRGDGGAGGAARARRARGVPRALGFHARLAHGVSRRGAARHGTRARVIHTIHRGQWTREPGSPPYGSPLYDLAHRIYVSGSFSGSSGRSEEHGACQFRARHTRALSAPRAARAPPQAAVPRARRFYLVARAPPLRRGRRPRPGARARRHERPVPGAGRVAGGLVGDVSAMVPP